MLLALDIGNTRIKTGIFNGDDLNNQNTFSSIDELFHFLNSISFSKAAISSVVPKRTSEINNFLTNQLNISPFIISKESRYNLKINYDTPESLGVDRICSAEGAFRIYKSTKDFTEYDSKTFLLAIDFGTATTINIVEYPGIFTGGIIAPGIHTMISSLNTNTAQLPQIDFNDYKGIIGKDTKSSIASGIINYTLGLINQVINFLKFEKKAETIKIFITGGNAEKLIPFLDFKFVYEKGLVLIGTKAVYENTKQ